MKKQKTQESVWTNMELSGMKTKSAFGGTERKAKKIGQNL